MKKWCKIIRQVLISLCLLCLFTGCNKKDVATDNNMQEQSGSDEVLWLASLNSMTYGCQGVFYDENNYIHFLDAATGESDIICDDATCPHTREKCSAYFDGVTYTALDGERLLLVTGHGGDKVGDMYLYEADVNGANRRQLAYLGNMQYIFQLMCTEDAIVIAYYNSYDENLEPMDEYLAGIYVYDRKTNSGELVWEKKALNSMVPKFVYRNDEVFFYSFYFDVTLEEMLEHGEKSDYVRERMCMEMCKVNVEDKAFSIIQDGVDDTNSLAFCQDKVWYPYENALWCYDIVTGEKSRALNKDVWALDTFGLNQLMLQEGDDYFTYIPGGELRRNAARENISITAVFPEITYAFDYNTETGNGEVVYWDTKNFMTQGDVVK